MRSTQGVPARAHELMVALADALAPHRDTELVIDLVGVARRIGAWDVVYRARTAHGYTEWTARGPRVVLSWAEVEGRRRALLAHEIGHLLLDPVVKPEALDLIPEQQQDDWMRRASTLLGIRRKELRRAIEDVPLEKLCDDLAYEMVFPDRLAAQWAPAIDSIDRLTDCRSALHVTLAVAVLKLNGFRAATGQSELGVVQARRTAGDYWMAASSYGLPGPWRGRVVLTTASSRLLDRLTPGENIRVAIGLTNGVSTVEVPAEIERHRERATVLVQSKLLRHHG